LPLPIISLACAGVILGTSALAVSSICLRVSGLAGFSLFIATIMGEESVPALNRSCDSNDAGDLIKPDEALIAAIEMIAAVKATL
jgi:hypothetical protein